eukprot:955940-Pelagomonas_calceolata.AAC.3
MHKCRTHTHTHTHSICRPATSAQQRSAPAVPAVHPHAEERPAPAAQPAWGAHPPPAPSSGSPSRKRMLCVSKHGCGMTTYA